MCVHLLDQENQARFSTISETKILKCCGEGYWPKQVAVSKNWVRSAACCLITKSLYIYNLSIIYMYMPSLASDLPHRTHRCRSTRSRLPLPKEAMCPAVASSNVRQVLGFLECMLYIYIYVCVYISIFIFLVSAPDGRIQKNVSALLYSLLGFHSFTQAPPCFARSSAKFNFGVSFPSHNCTCVEKPTRTKFLETVERKLLWAPTGGCGNTWSNIAWQIQKK